MAATIKIKNSSTTGAVPTASDLVQGELAVNVTDTGLYTENASGTVVKLNAPSIDDKNTGATKHLTISTGGNLGLGVTPSAWSVGYSMDVGAQTSAHYSISIGTLFGKNVYYNSGYKYKATGTARAYVMDDGGHSWSIAASGTAGNAITFTQAMTLDASGNLGVGTTSPSTRLHAKGTGGTIATFERDASGTIAYFNRNAGGGNAGAIIGADSVAGYFAGGNSTSNMVYLDSVNSLAQFYTNGSERARIDSSGNLLVGTTSNLSSTAAKIQVAFDSSSIWGMSFKPTGSSSSALVFLNTSSSVVGSINNTASATTYVTSSDYRLKDNIAPMTGALDKVAALKPCTYTWKIDGSTGQGFIAHELQAVVPDAVVGEKDAVNEDGSIKAQGIDTSFLVATLTAAIQEQQAIIEQLKADVAALKG